jgi:hypothetical protein
VKEADCEASPLWQRTLGATRRDDYSQARERLRLSYLATRRNAAVLLNELAKTTPNFTVHDISHADALWETASLICGTTTTLTPAEAYVLGCAFIFHDAAMGAAAYTKDIPSAIGRKRWLDLLSTFMVNETGQWPSEVELESPPADILASCTECAIREMHAAQAATLVDQPWTTSAGNQLYLIEDLQLREFYGPLVGDLAASHGWDVDDLHGTFKRIRGSLTWQSPDWIVDPLKLACILRLADAIQIDSRRAPTFLFALRSPMGQSREHWRFQEHVARPRLVGDRVTYNAWRPFEAVDADSWWLALDYLRQVDFELKAVDSLLHDLNKPRLDARAVAGVDTPERFAELFPVKGWRPVDARLGVSDVPALVEMLGGEQLYGREPEIAVRELVQNAQDAVVARRVLDPGFVDDEIRITLSKHDGEWVLEVVDRGIGMDEEILTGALLDFGCTGWTADSVRKKFVGLTGAGFQPKGRFGIGFFSVFMLGDAVEITTRRFDAGPADARRLRFRGIRSRPILTRLATDERVAAGTTVRVVLKVDPYDRAGIFARTLDDSLAELVQHLAPEHSVPIRVHEDHRNQSTMLPPVDLKTLDAADVFDVLYPPVNDGGAIGEVQRVDVRKEFELRATEQLDADGQRIGLAVLGRDLVWGTSRDLMGAVLVNGLHGDGYQFFTGYMEGRPSRASRDKVDLVADADEFRQWLASQEARLRELGRFHMPTQLEFGQTLYQSRSTLSDDHHLGMASNGLIPLGDIVEWVAARSEVILCQGWPLVFYTRPPSIFHYMTGVAVTLPENWFHVGPTYLEPLIDDLLGRNNDSAYESARLDHVLTWQKQWWRRSAWLNGLFIKKLCEAWSCNVGDVLAPVAERGWSDFADLGIAGVGPVPVYHLRRPV